MKSKEFKNVEISLVHDYDAVDCTEIWLVTTYSKRSRMYIDTKIFYTEFTAVSYFSSICDTMTAIENA